MRRLLVLSCSRRKRSDPGLLPAIERYDGPPFRVLRRYLRQQPADPPDVYILSAEFGLMHGDRPIPYYDRLMTPQRARELRPVVVETLRSLSSQRRQSTESSQSVYLNLSQIYFLALSDEIAVDLGRLQPTGVAPPGVRLTRLRDWLRGEQESAAMPWGVSGNPDRGAGRRARAQVER